MSKLVKLILISLTINLSFLLLSCDTGEKITGIPVNFQKVISGNTIEVLWTKEGKTTLETIRLMGIKAPDIKQNPWGKQAQKTLESLLTLNPQSLSLLLELDNDKPDQYGRFWAFVWYEKKLINEEIIKQGLAITDLCPVILPKKTIINNQKEKYCKRLSQAQQYARVMGLGIWNNTNPLREIL
jgi:micrococcal nuclease